jgi:hypothetical protein
MFYESAPCMSWKNEGGTTVHAVQHRMSRRRPFPGHGVFFMKKKRQSAIVIVVEVEVE